MNLERVFFTTEDNLELTGLLSKNLNNSTGKIIVSVHGMQSNCLKQREAILEKEFNNKEISYFSFNNRGQDLMCYTKMKDGTKNLNGGSVFEDILDSYYDIKGAIDEVINRGFKEIYLQGHSLGCTKIVYTYNKLKKEKYKNLNCIKGIVLLSLVDIVDCQKYDLGIEKYNEALNYAIQREKENRLKELMPIEYFEHPISVKSYLRYYRDNRNIDFAKFSDKEYKFKELNNIEVPLFLRWGNVHDLVIQNLGELISFLKERVINSKLDIGYIDGADHGYTGKEKELAKEIIQFIQK